jgi:hypothetical protein
MESNESIIFAVLNDERHRAAGLAEYDQFSPDR